MYTLLFRFEVSTATSEGTFIFTLFDHCCKKYVSAVVLNAGEGEIAFATLWCQPRLGLVNADRLL